MSSAKILASKIGATAVASSPHVQLITLGITAAIYFSLFVTNWIMVGNADALKNSALSTIGWVSAVFILLTVLCLVFGKFVKKLTINVKLIMLGVLIVLNIVALILAEVDKSADVDPAKKGASVDAKNSARTVLIINGIWTLLILFYFLASDGVLEKLPITAGFTLQAIVKNNILHV